MNRYVIDRALLEGNIACVLQAASVPVMGVVKANGYGFGLREMALALKAQGVNSFAITELEDIAPLRDAVGEGADILVMRSTALADEARHVVESGCIASVGSVAAADALAAAARAAGVRARCHLKVDTGFGRYGFLPAQMDDVLACYAREDLAFEGMYTHFAAAYHDVAATRAQLSALEQVAEQVERAGFAAGVRHAANSPALFNVPEAKLDMVRIGSAFTGRVITLAPTPLERVGYLEAQVIDVKTLPAGSGVGYGGATRGQARDAGGVRVGGHAGGLWPCGGKAAVPARRAFRGEGRGGPPPSGGGDRRARVAGARRGGPIAHAGGRDGRRRARGRLGAHGPQPMMVSPKVPRVYV